MQRMKWIVFVFFAWVLWQSWGFFTNPEQQQVVKNQQQAPDLSIVSGSENQALQPLIERWADEQDVNIEIVYQGSVDIYRSLQQGTDIPFDAVWPANHLWIELGDTHNVVRHEQSIMRSPVVLGLKRSIAQQLGWDKQAVSVTDILQAAEQSKFRLAMTSATQSNSGANAYLSFLYAMSGYPDTLKLTHLNDPQVQERVQRLLATVDRSSGSSGWLKEAFQQHPEHFDAMFNYESLIIEANQSLQQQQQEPLQVIYPQNGVAVADSPLGYIDKGNAEKEQLFLALQAHLLAESTQQYIENMGRRTGLLGMQVSKPDYQVWNPDWGIKAQEDIAVIPTPQQAVIQAALDMYQTELRKPSLTVWVLDVSGSMAGQGMADLQRAMTTLLDPKLAQQHLLQMGEKDITIIIPFSGGVEAIWQLSGNQPSTLQQALQHVQKLEAGGGTDLYAALATALQQLEPFAEKGELRNYLPAIVAMTDGRSNERNIFAFQQALQRLPFVQDVPIHAIAFGEADDAQMQALAAQSIGRFFKVKQDLPSILRKAKGYN